MLAYFVGLCLAPAVATAQAVDCPAIIQAALDAADEACNQTGRNQACYGNVTLNAQPQADVTEFDFDERGERVDVANVSTLELRPWSEDGQEWGIALMKLQTNIPDTLPGQNVTFLLFGDVRIENPVATNTEPVTFEVTASGTAYLRGEPDFVAEFTGELPDGESAMVIGRTADSEWILLELADQSTGWTSYNSVRTDGDFSLLNVVGPTAEPPQPPMQAFYFQSGIADAPCAGAPDSGILVQTPEGAAQVEFTVNEVNIRLGSTIYLQAQPAGDMTISIVEGQARVEAQGVAVVAPAGTLVRIPLDNNRQASGPPLPEPYGDLSNLPVRILDRAITVATPLTADQITRLAAPPAETTDEPPSQADNIQLVSGLWRWATIQQPANCAPRDMVIELYDIVIESQDEGATLIMTFSSNGTPRFTRTWTRVEQNTYFEQVNEGVELTLRLISPEHFILEGVIVILLDETDEPECLRDTNDLALITPAEEGS
jgi:hypothetical protein